MRVLGWNASPRELMNPPSRAQGPNIDDSEMKGITPRITEQIFSSIMSSPASLEYLVKVSYMEIYMERIRDLLAREFACARLRAGAAMLTVAACLKRRTTTSRSTRTRRRACTSRACRTSTSATHRTFSRSCGKEAAREPFHPPVRSSLSELSRSC